MKRTLYLECYSGISGDMTVGALLDLGADAEVLMEQLNSLPLEGFRVEISRVKKSGLDACDFHVILEKPYENHDHDNHYLYDHHDHSHPEGHIHTHSHDHPDGHIHTHSHGHSHPDDHTHAHIHRGLHEVLEIIENSAISLKAKRTASDIFRILAEAEAQAHGATIDTVHFHEVGAVDSIVDIVAVAVCLESLGITDVIVPELYEGRGTIRCQHGIIPVPVPAVMNIARQYGLILHLTETEAELVTPTGAAIVAAVSTGNRLPDKYKILKTGMGAGKRDYGRTSILRAMLIQEETHDDSYIYKLESNIDDCTGEALGYTMEQLFAAGARDVHYIPVYMKKNRPAYQLNVICTEQDIPVMEKIIFQETTTIGIRRIKMGRTVLRRRIRTMQTTYGEAQVKLCEVGGSIKAYPEYESVKKICREQSLSYQEVWNRVHCEVQEALMEEMNR